MNHHLKLLQSLYSSASGKYLKFKVRLDKAIQTGRFYKLNKRKQSTLFNRLYKLYERLKSLQMQLRLAGAGSALVLTLSISSPAQAQNSLGPFVRKDALNPFPPPVNINSPRPAVVDIDNDGDLDVFVGTNNGDIEFFKNDSPTGKVKRFTPVTGTSNPMGTVNKGLNAALAFTDVDGDLDYDLLLGTYEGNTFFFKNTGSRTNPVFTEQTGLNNPFDGITGTTSKYGTAPAIPVFVDFDGDSDVDLFIGSSYLSDFFGGHYAVQYFENTAGNINPQENFLASELGNLSGVALTFVDMDEDGDLDAFVGDSGSNFIRCFRHDIESTFTQVYGTWNPALKTGNPFNGFSFDNYVLPVAADFDKDGDFDFLIGNQYFSSYRGPNNSNLRYFENTDGDFIIKDRTDLNISPFGGVDVGKEAAPVFVDLDNDGDLDALIGTKYSDPDLFVYLNTDGEFTAAPNHSLANILQPFNYGFTYDVIPVFADIDEDGDKDLFITLAGSEVLFFRNTGGNFTNEPTLFPSLTSANSRELSLAFIDVDSDNDFDAIFSNDRYGQPQILYFENTGSATSPVFTAVTPPAPFGDGNHFDHSVNFLSVDLDNDGDTDLAASETYYNGWYGDSDAMRTWFFENTSNGTFTEPTNPLIIEQTPLSFTSFTDLDGDGDLDAFVGNGYTFDFEQNGKVFFFENTNPPPVTQVPPTTVPVDGGAATLVIPTMVLTDTDNDQITQAIISIANFRAGEEIITFTPQSGITGSFNASTGILTLSGLAPVSVYQQVLRSVTYQFIGTPPTTSGRLSSGRTKDVTLNRSLTISVLDQDLTSIVPKAIAVQISFPDPNVPPVITASASVVGIGNSVDIDFTALISDPNNNLDASSFKVIQDPVSGATYSITGLVIKLDYSGKIFAGQDQFTVEICDLDGACTSSIVTVTVEGDIIVYNGFSPNGDASNPYFQVGNITLIEPQNKVTIFNRWGDRVFEIDNYDNNTKRFDGKNSNGNELPSGVYFYRIEFSSGREELSGYLTIKK